MNTKEAHQKVGVTHNAPLLGLPVQYKAGSNGKENMQKKSEFKRIPYAAPNTPISTEASSSEISFSGICGSQWVTEYMESFGFPQLPRPAPPKKPAPPKASFRKLQRPPHPRTEYQTVFGPKKNQSSRGSLMLPPIHQSPQRHPLQKSPSVASGRVPKPAPRKTEQFILPHGPDVEASCGSQWVTEYMESFGFPQLPRPAPPKKPAPPKASFRKLQRPPHPRTEYQTVFGPKFRTADFDVLLYRQLHGTA
ncbi:hypothetical protein KOW79_015312 [Hemibagrus wyckioides]|uniref:Uncharacterized protein n=1 Tax=Hemibagrus wyckioides TaxID=337641 RepID=A0A9D3NHH6_9TELE|nr:hypothetical protein KOW79_015312 [Hemibagrus wyckioides]